MKKIFEIAEVRNFITARNARFSPYLILEGKLGKATFNFSTFGKILHINLTCHKLSGNGRLSLAGHELAVHSKFGQIVEISGYNCFEITRVNGIGEVGVSKVELIYEEPVNWKAIINQVGKTSMVTLQNGKLFASVGGTIPADNIASLETSPPNMYVREGNFIKFLGQCEIINITLSSTATPVKTPLFEPRDAAAPIHQNPPITPVPTKIKIKSMINVDIPPPQEPSLILFDTQNTGFSQFRANFYDGAEYLKNAGKDAALIKSGSSFLLPVSNLLPDKSYIILINGKKLNGNGKLSVSLVSDSDEASQDIILSHNYADQIITLKTNPNTSQQIYKLRFTMNFGPGEVLICRIQILEAAGNTNEPIYYTRRPLNLNNIKRFVIVIPSYNNVKWCQKNIESVLNQQYEHFRIIFTDDNSVDGTFEKVQEIVNNSGKISKCTLIKNKERLGALQNLYNMIHSCDDDEIILTLDGDDFLANNRVLNILGKYYSDNNIWMTYGQYQNYPDNGRGICSQIPDHIIKSNLFRGYQWCSSHLRTFYAWLFKCIKREDLMKDGEFFKMTWDMGFMYPCLELSGEHSKFISEILYMYNLENPINDHKVNVQLQRDLDKYIRAMPKYNKLPYPVSHDPFVHKNHLSIGLMIIATGKYHRFIQDLITSADNYFLNDSRYTVTYYLFSEKSHNINSKRQVIPLHIDHRPFPYASMDRFAHFTKYADQLNVQDYIYYIDVDTKIVDKVDSEILGNLVAVTHCGFVNRPGPVEDKPTSVLYIDPKKYKYYFGGGFSGGRTGAYLNLASWCKEMIDKDIKNELIPIFHDETAINRYFLDHEPDVILTPSYHYPQSDLIQYKKIWGGANFTPKIILLEKNHKEIRE